MRYMKAVDFRAHEEAIMSGEMKLQPGQWIDIHGDGNLSVFHFVRDRYIRAYHGASSGDALRQFRYVMRRTREVNARRKAA